MTNEQLSAHILATTEDCKLWHEQAVKFIQSGSRVLHVGTMLVGFLTHCHDGSFLFSVRPDCRRQGLGTHLLRQEHAANPIDWQKSTYSDAGLACVQAFIRSL